MLVIEVLIEHGTYSLNRPFSYAYLGDKNINKGVRVIVPFNNKHVVGFVSEISESHLSIQEYQKEFGYEIKEIIAILDEESLFSEELLLLSNEIASYYITPLVKVYKTMLPPSLKPSSSSLKKAKIAYEIYLVALEGDTSTLSAAQYEIYHLIASSSEVKKSEIKHPSIIKSLINKGLIKEERKEKQRYKFKDIEEDQINELLPQQEKVIKEFEDSKDSIFLLQGVTGSGKTEVYLKLSELTLARHQQVIVLVPEISLTPQMMKLFFARFPHRVAILHSELSEGEKYDEYRRIKKGEVDIVVGTRSAIFAPFTNIGLIIIDEEHVESYKQENPPCYHAKEVAIMRLKHFKNAKLLLGSATPSLESKARAKKGVYHLLKMDNRVNNYALPSVRIIDMNDHSNIDYDSSMFSLTLRNEIKKRLENKEQVILLLNRRGYSTSIICRDCNEVIKCPECSLPLTYHSATNTLKCHYCGHSEFYSDTCPTCHQSHLIKIGFGIEKVVEEVNRLFPSARTLRLDSDVGQIKNNIQRILKAFQNHEADILIGTQMIAKGHDFPNVTLVGVVLADLGLSIPNFHASERTFELLTQAIGRAGRADKLGEAIIQTYMPSHYAIRLAKLQDYEEFYKEEMVVRKIQQYPPFTYVSTITLSSTDEEDLEKVSYDVLANLANEVDLNEVTLIGPSTPFYRSSRMFKKEIVIKYKKYKEVATVLRELVEVFAKRSKINLTIDVDSI